MKILIRLQWSFDGCDPGASRLPYASALLASTGRSEQAFALASVRGEFVGEVEVGAGDEFEVTAIRQRGQCPSRSPRTGARCTRKELHGPDHLAQLSEPGGCSVERWKDGGDWVIGCPSTSNP